MKIDFTKPLMALDGTPLKASPDPKGPDMTLQDAAISGLLAAPKDGQGTVRAAADAFKLALRISNACKEDTDRLAAHVKEHGDPSGFKAIGCEIDAAESTVIKEGVGRAFNYAPNVCGPVDLLLEGQAIVKE
ncbi:hypothetical protein LB572_02970 [Mesorhizobium sp. BH1-1-5]|uniref:hypothetical protein n=1 Tax=Mesorhizobium sp. BH1-1-5 TaxID=2876661 RepID=UPI001CCF887D|nr:hypothetical protein [Mesorhizobium sp. BH1-1-5]MBZ9986054.1 hypothetical protein [Mesorhizobium sp. BH1-1-5]